jgi:hypothetical protein
MFQVGHAFWRCCHLHVRCVRVRVTVACISLRDHMLLEMLGMLPYDIYHISIVLVVVVVVVVVVVASAAFLLSVVDVSSSHTGIISCLILPLLFLLCFFLPVLDGSAPLLNGRMNEVASAPKIKVSFVSTVNFTDASTIVLFRI